MIEDPVRFNRAIALFDAANAEDPNLDEGQPKELQYGHRMSDMINRFAPDASEAAQLAVRAQHIRRWTVPRNTYPMTKDGYHAWRTGLYTFHANTAGELMREAGYGDAMIERVKKAVGKRGIKVNPESQLLEDIANLVFIEHYMLAFCPEQARLRRGEVAGDHPPHLGQDVEGRPGVRPVRQDQAAGTPLAADHQGDQSVSGVDETLLHSAHSFTHPAVPFWMNSIG